MRVNGTLINYYFHCKRQCYLHGNRINLEDNSELVHIGKVLHELRDTDSKKELAIDNIKIDQLSKEYITEYKKSDADVEAARWQLLFYLKKLKEKGIERKGKLVFEEKTKQERKIIIVCLTEETENQLNKLITEIEELIEQADVPQIIKSNKCKKCAYYTYCYI